MTDRDDFLCAIHAEPTNYLHRYVFADWLDEHGEHEEADRQRNYEAAEKWLMAFATDEGFSFNVRPGGYAEGDWIDGYEGLIEMAGTGLWERGCFGTTSGPDEAKTPDFWRNLEVVTGRQFEATANPEARPYFRCAC